MICAFLTLALSLLIIPISLSAKIFISLNGKKFFYSLFLFKNLRLNSGFVRYKDKFVVISYSDKKAIAVRPNKLMPTSEMNANFIRFEPLKIKSALILGEKEFKDVIIGITLNTFHAVIYSVLREIKPYCDYRGDIYFSSLGEYGALIEFRLGFCIFLLLEMLTQKLIGSIVNYAKKNFR